LYFIDKLALRVGNEKGEDEADTVGCCSLRVEHIELLKDNTISFDFLGKDSIRYQNEVKVEPTVYKNLKEFVKGKAKTDSLFDLLNTTSLNTYLKSWMEKLTAKVFRTYNASIVLDQQLTKKLKIDNVNEKVAAYNDANRQVAILCNHQRTVPKTFATQLERIDKGVRKILLFTHVLLDG
jgi:DNA topoisomerase I